MASEEDVTLQEFIKASNSFTPIAYKELLKVHKENFLTSPLSAEIVLAFVHSGCKGETAEEIRNALRLPEDKDKIEDGIKTLLPALGDGENYALHTANKIYILQGFILKEEFKRVAAETYQSAVENIDFSNKEVAAERMNKWVEEQTNNKIKNLIDSGNLDKFTRAVIINALYFKADWVKEFLLAETNESNFYITANDFVRVDTMHYYNHYKDRFDFYQSKELNAKFLRLPFNGYEAAMVFVLPNEREGLASLERQIDKVFASYDFEQCYLNIALPKFKINTEIDFKKLLQNLGVDKAFDEKQADLSGIAGNKGDLFINAIIQKTFIDVSEEGVEAAAATFVEYGIPIRKVLRAPPVYVFFADHPFIFYIRIKGAIAFAGRVTNPLL